MSIVWTAFAQLTRSSLLRTVVSPCRFSAAASDAGGCFTMYGLGQYIARRLGEVPLGGVLLGLFWRSDFTISADVVAYFLLLFCLVEVSCKYGAYCQYNRLRGRSDVWPTHRSRE